MAGRENLVGESIASVALAALSALTTNRRHGPCRRWTRRFRPTGLRPQLEVLERIRLLTIWTVNSMGYVGAKGQEDWSQVYPSLKPGDTVKFDIVAGQVWVDPNDPNVTYTDPDGPYVLPPESDVFQGSITLNGTTQPHFQPGQPQIYFENTNNPVTIEGGNSTIEGLGFADDITLELTNLGGDTVQDCVFGIDPSNGQPDGAGLQILCNNNTIGGIAANAGNVFAGASPIDLNDAMGNLIEGNWLGTDKSGTFEQGTDENGINILNGSSNNTIGGTTAGAGNVIAYNQQNGVAIYLPPAGSGTPQCTGDAILGNEIFGNGDLGIDLGDTLSPLQNDAKGHTGPNDYQDYPIVSGPDSSGAITGTRVQSRHLHRRVLRQLSLGLEPRTGIPGRSVRHCACQRQRPALV